MPTRKHPSCRWRDDCTVNNEPAVIPMPRRRSSVIQTRCLAGIVPQFGHILSITRLHPFYQRQYPHILDGYSAVSPGIGYGRLGLAGCLADFKTRGVSSRLAPLIKFRQQGTTELNRHS